MAIAIFERWGLNPREQRMATGATFVLAIVLLLAIPVGLSMLVSSRTTENEDLRTALNSVNQARGKIKERQDRKASIASRYAKKTPQLGGFIEQAASGAKVSIGDSVDRPDSNHGKQYVERHTVVHLKNSGLGPVVRFLEILEKSEFPISVTRLNIRKRSGDPDSYGPIEVGISAYDRNAPATTATPATSASAAPPTK